MHFPKTFPTLETERLVLRQMIAADAPAIFAIYSDPTVMRYWSSAPMTEIGEANALIDREADTLKGRSAIKWGIALKDDDRLIGNCTLFKIDAQSRRAEIGYALHREHWGKGLMNEALTAMIDFGFDSAGLVLQRLEADLDPRNEASERALTRLGFQREGLLRDRWIVAGETTDSLIMGLLRKEWTGSEGS